MRKPQGVVWEIIYSSSDHKWLNFQCESKNAAQGDKITADQYVKLILD